jgi:hypothetical protein
MEWEIMMLNESSQSHKDKIKVNKNRGEITREVEGIKKRGLGIKDSNGRVNTLKVPCIDVWKLQLIYTKKKQKNLPQ